MITGTSPVPQPVPQRTPPVPGSQLPPIVVHPNPQIVITGHSPVTPPGATQVPQTAPYLVPILVPTPTPTPVPGRVPPQRPAITPVIVPFQNPGVTTGVSPNQVPHPATVTVPTLPPQRVPTPVPQRVPQPTPQMIPVTVPVQPQVPTPGATGPAGGAQPTPVAVLRPKPRPQSVPTLTTNPGATIEHRPQVQTPPIGQHVVTREIGRQPEHNAPRFQTTRGEVIRCVASGHGKRRSVVDGEVESSGALRHVGSVDVLGRDLPALHPRHSKCIVTVKRRKD
ncbi:hypothetical protein [Marivita sp.]|uniref:hypothetical protein n=1 Tax=Marivita sp. TaxID=2003365 RepID=UPI0025BCCEC3|nr:hypothetical protein [Marivita sp.]